MKLRGVLERIPRPEAQRLRREPGLALLWFVMLRYYWRNGCSHREAARP